MNRVLPSNIMRFSKPIFCAALASPRNLGRLAVAVLLVSNGAACAAAEEAVFIDAEEAADYPTFRYQGEYAGQVKWKPGAEPEPVALRVAAYGESDFRARLYHGGFPGEDGFAAAGEKAVDLHGRYEDRVLEFSGAGDLRFRFIFNRFTALDETNTYQGRLDRVERSSPTLGQPPPEGAVPLFDGSGLDHWRDGAEMTSEGLLKQGAFTAEEYGDMRLHVEAKLGFMPEHRNQRRGNSGLYLQNRYEVQVLDSFALPPAVNGNASLYNVSTPLVNASLPPLSWQTYDIFFRAPRFDREGDKTENARVSVYLNGVLVQDDLELERGTGAGGRREEVARAAVDLQDHTGPVRFRNVWLVEESYSPPGTPRLTPETAANDR